jgi:hypothetical protein
MQICIKKSDMETPQIIFLNHDEFLKEQMEFIASTIRQEFEKRTTTPFDDEVLLVDDLCKIFKRTRQTINLWEEKGIIKPHRINDSPFYLKSEILNLIKTS